MEAGFISVFQSRSIFPRILLTARGHVRRAMGQDLLLEKGKCDENEGAHFVDFEAFITQLYFRGHKG